MRWFITGSAGFIGSNLVARLIEQGDEVIGLDNLSAGKQENVDRVMTKANGRYQFVKGDIRNSDEIEACLEGKMDVVVHLAAQGSVQKSFSDVAYNNAQNIDGFLNVLTTTGKREISRFVYASSCAVYGETEDLPITESHCPAPVSPYASSKLMNDLLSRNVAHLFPKTIITGLRFFNIFGPWQDPFGDYAAVIPKWIDMCLSGQQPIIFGEGQATRDFCYVGNVCDLIEVLARSEASENQTSTVFNVASEVPTSLNGLFAAVTEALKDKGVELPFDSAEYRPWREGDIIHSLGSIDLVRKKIGFEPKVDLVNGILCILNEQYGL